MSTHNEFTQIKDIMIDVILDRQNNIVGFSGIPDQIKLAHINYYNLKNDRNFKKLFHKTIFGFKMYYQNDGKVVNIDVNDSEWWICCTCNTKLAFKILRFIKDNYDYDKVVLH